MCGARVPQIGFSLAFLLALRYFIWDRVQREEEQQQAVDGVAPEQRASRAALYAVQEAVAGGGVGADAGADAGAGANGHNHTLNELAIQIEEETPGQPLAGPGSAPAAIEGRSGSIAGAGSPAAQFSGYTAIPPIAPAFEEAGPSHATPARHQRASLGQTGAPTLRQPRVSVLQALVATATSDPLPSKTNLRSMPSVVSTLDSPATDFKSSEERDRDGPLKEQAEYAAKLVAPFGQGMLCCS